MIRLLSAVMVAILCHSSTTWAHEFSDVEAFSPELIAYSIDIVKQAQDLGAIRTCPTERCLKHRTLKQSAKPAVGVIALAALAKITTPATIRALIASVATKSLARLGLAAIGVVSAYAVVVAYAVYETTISAIQPIESIPLADAIMFNDENRARLLRMPREQILNMAMNDRLLGHELVILAHAVSVASERAQSNQR